jgi:N-acetylneuraminate synthase
VNSHLNLQVIETLRDLFQLPVGYSGHEKGILPSVIAASKFRACIIERHVTIDRSMWGSDQSASLEPAGMSKLVQYLKESIECCGDGVKKVLDSEISLAKKLRRVQDF